MKTKIRLRAFLTYLQKTFGPFPPGSKQPAELVIVKDGDEAVVEIWYDASMEPDLEKKIVWSYGFGYQYQEVTYTYRGKLQTMRLWVRRVQCVPISPEMKFGIVCITGQLSLPKHRVPEERRLGILFFWVR